MLIRRCCQTEKCHGTCFFFVFFVFCFFRLLDWVDRDTRKKQDRIVVFKNVFDAEAFEASVLAKP